MSLRSEQRSQWRDVLCMGVNPGHRAGERCCRCRCYGCAVEKREGGNMQRENRQRERGADCWRSADCRWRGWPVGRRSSCRGSVLQQKAFWVLWSWVFGNDAFVMSLKILRLGKVPRWGKWFIVPWDILKRNDSRGAHLTLYWFLFWFTWLRQPHWLHILRKIPRSV
jgi:hypothetical protein